MDNQLIIKIHNLPNELINLIKEYVPKKCFIFTNRENYKLYHYLTPINPLLFPNYIRDVIHRDNEYTLDAIIRENYEKWINNGHVYYRNIRYANNLYFILNYAFEYESENCLKIIFTFLKEHGLDKNLHKKILVKYIKWKNST
jgi:hypothetical protein